MTRHLSSLVMVLAVPALLAAQAPPQQPPATPAAVQAPAPAVSDASPRVDRIPLTAGRSSVMTTDFDITRIAVTNPAIADATVVEPREILLDGKSAGTVSLIVWGAGTRRQYDIVVEPGVSALQQQLQALFPGEDIKVDSNEDAVILSGRVSSTAVMLKAGRDCEGQRLEGEGAEPAPAPRRQRQPAGDAAGPLRRGEPQRPAGAGRVVLHRRQRLRELPRPDHHAAVFGAELRHLGHQTRR